MLTSPREQWPIRVGAYEAIDAQPTPSAATAQLDRLRPARRWAAALAACLIGAGRIGILAPDHSHRDELR